MVEWGQAFEVPVWLHAADRQHVMRPDPCLRFWDGEAQPLLPGLTLHRLGGHFAGGTIAHWAAGAGGRCTARGDILQVMPDRKHLGFMRSYPCLIPLPPAEVQRMAAYCDRLDFDAIYGAFHEREIAAGGKAAWQSRRRGTAPGWRGWSRRKWRRRQARGFGGASSHAQRRIGPRVNRCLLTL